MLQGNYNWAEQVLAAAASGGSDTALYVTCQVRCRGHLFLDWHRICFECSAQFAWSWQTAASLLPKSFTYILSSLYIYIYILLLKFVAQVFHFLVLNRSSHFLPCRTAIRNQTFAAPTAHQQPQQRPAEPPPQPHLCRLPPARGTRIAWRHKIVAMAKSAPSTMSRSRG